MEEVFREAGREACVNQDVDRTEEMTSSTSGEAMWQVGQGQWHQLTLNSKGQGELSCEECQKGPDGWGTMAVP